MHVKGLTASQFADSMEVPRAVLSHILSERNKPSLDVIIKIASTFPDISMPWLLMGKGEMLSTFANPVQEAAAPTPPANSETTPASPPEEPKQKPSPKKEKVQIDHQDAAFLSAVFANPKSIEQVMVLYTDKTFAVYRPEK